MRGLNFTAPCYKPTFTNPAAGAFLRRVPFLLTILVLFSASAFAQVTIEPGDILVADPGANAIILVDPGTGAQTVVSQNGLLIDPFGVAVEEAGTIVVADSSGAVIRINPATGTQETVFSGAPLIVPRGIVVEATGDILVSDDGGPFGSGAIIRIAAPTFGTATVLSSGQFFVDPTHLALEASGLTVVVADRAAFVTGQGGLIRVVLAGGAQTVLSQGGSFGCPHGVAVEASGSLVSGTDNATQCSPPPEVIRVNQTTGAQTVITSGPPIERAIAFAVEANGNIIVADPNAGTGGGGIIRVTGGTATVISTGINFVDPTGVTVVPGDSGPPPLTGADLSVTKTDNTNTVTAGDGVTRTYTITVNNAGPLPASNVTLSDTWPTGFAQGTITPSQGSCSSPSGGNFTCNLGTIGLNGSATVTVNYTVPATTPPGTQTNTVTVSSSTTDPSTANNTASDSTTVATSANLGVTKTDNRTTVEACCTTIHQYIITVTNSGPSQATNVILTDDFPNGFQRGTTTPSQGTCTSGSGGDFTCSLGNLAPGSTATVTVNYTVPITTPPGPQTNTVNVTSATPDSNQNNNNASDSTTVVATADLSATKTDGVTTVTAGDGVTRTYTITVTNNGPSMAANVMADDVWPGGFTRGTITPSQGTCTPNGNNFNCSLGSLAPGASATISVNYTVPASTPAGNQTNTVCVTTSSNDPNANNNLASDTNQVVTSSANLSITKTDGVTSVTAGDNITRTFIITVSNAGPAAATGVSVSDTWPSGYSRGTITPSSGTCTPSGSNFTCALGTINSGANKTISVKYTVPASTPAGNQTNTVTVTSSTFDPNTSNNTASDTNYVNAAPPASSADVKIIKNDSADPVNPGASFNYSLSISNQGPQTATNLTVTDTLPTGLTYVSASGSGWTCSYNSSTRKVTCTKSSLSSGASSSITINVTAPSSTGTITNTASVTSSTSDPNSGNNSDSETTTVAASSTPAKWYGYGEINVIGGKAAFGFVVERSSSGALRGKLGYYNQVTKYLFESLTITSMTVTGNKVVFSGTGRSRIDEGPWMTGLTFTATAYDFEPDSNDRFKITISDGTSAGSETTPIRKGEVEQQN